MSWIKINQQLPPRNTVVMTKIVDENGERNEQPLKLGKDNNLWWLADGSMYVYYIPTHWRHKC